MTHHKADICLRGQDALVTKRCHSLRPEGQIRFDKEVVLKAYFGMGTSSSHPSSYSFVAFGTRSSVMATVVQLLKSSSLPMGVDRQGCLCCPMVMRI